MKALLFLLLTFGLSATVGPPPKIYPVEINSNICCVQGPNSCACCEEFFGNCKNDWVFEYYGRCIKLPLVIREIRQSTVR